MTGVVLGLEGDVALTDIIDRNDLDVETKSRLRPSTTSDSLKLHSGHLAAPRLAQ